LAAYRHLTACGFLSTTFVAAIPNVTFTAISRARASKAVDVPPDLILSDRDPRQANNMLAVLILHGLVEHAWKPLEGCA